MKKIISQIMVSVDGFIEDSNHQLDWHQVDDEYNEYANHLLENTDSILFGRKTYQLMESYWPTVHSNDDSPKITHKMNHLPKIVFSKTLKTVTWDKTILIQENVEHYVKELKQQSGDNLLILGSGELVSSLTNASLIDEYHIVINPILLGEGTPYLKNISERIPFKLIRTKVFKSGNVLLCYQLKN